MRRLVFESVLRASYYYHRHYQHLQLYSRSSFASLRWAFARHLETWPHSVVACGMFKLQAWAITSTGVDSTYLADEYFVMQSSFDHVLHLIKLRKNYTR